MAWKLSHGCFNCGEKCSCGNPSTMVMACVLTHSECCGAPNPENGEIWKKVSTNLYIHFQPCTNCQRGVPVMYVQWAKLCKLCKEARDAEDLARRVCMCRKCSTSYKVAFDDKVIQRKWIVRPVCLSCHHFLKLVENGKFKCPHCKLGFLWTHNSLAINSYLTATSCCAGGIQLQPVHKEQAHDAVNMFELDCAECSAPAHFLLALNLDVLCDPCKKRGDIYSVVEHLPHCPRCCKTALEGPVTGTFCKEAQFARAKNCFFFADFPREQEKKKEKETRKEQEKEKENEKGAVIDSKKLEDRVKSLKETVRPEKGKFRRAAKSSPPTNYRQAWQSMVKGLPVPKRSLRFSRKNLLI